MIFYFGLTFLLTVLFKGIIVFIQTGIFPFVEGKGKTGKKKLLGIFQFVFLLFALFSIMFQHKVPFFNEVVITFGSNPALPEIPFIGEIIFLFSYLIFIVSLFNMGRSWRIGVDESSQEKLIKTGLYKYSRNPIYVGLIGIAFSFFIIHSLNFHFLLFLLVVVAVHFKIREEETFLISHYGDEYKAYMYQTGRYWTFFNCKI